MYEILEWDSDFFGLKIAKIAIDNTNCEQFENIKEYLKNMQVRLVYCIISPDNLFNNLLKTKHKGFLADEKIVYSQNVLNRNFIPPNNIYEYSNTEPTETLLDLAIQSSEYSRFRVDKNFPKNSCNRLYSQWITNSVKKIFDNAVYVYQENNLIKGLITLKDKDNIGTISILSVDKNERGKNIGTQLINTAFLHYQKSEIYDIEVVTQKSNLLACRFYEKNGFKVKTIENIYHIWL